MIIKRIRYEDLVPHEDEIISLLTETYMINFNLSHELSTNMSEEKVKQLHGYIQDGSAIIFAALEDEKLCGFVWVYTHDFFGEKRFHINQIVIDSKYRGKGIAKKLIKKVEENALIDGIKTIDLFVSEVNSIAHSIYEGLGFETERRYMKKEL